VVKHANESAASGGASLSNTYIYTNIHSYGDAQWAQLSITKEAKRWSSDSAPKCQAASGIH